MLVHQRVKRNTSFGALARLLWGVLSLATWDYFVFSAGAGLPVCRWAFSQPQWPMAHQSVLFVSKKRDDLFTPNIQCLLVLNHTSYHLFVVVFLLNIFENGDFLNQNSHTLWNKKRQHPVDPRFQEFGHTLATRGAGETAALGVRLTYSTYWKSALCKSCKFYLLFTVVISSSVT